MDIRMKQMQKAYNKAMNKTPKRKPYGISPDTMKEIDEAWLQMDNSEKLRIQRLLEESDL